MEHSLAYYRVLEATRMAEAELRANGRNPDTSGNDARVNDAFNRINATMLPHYRNEDEWRKHDPNHVFAPHIDALHRLYRTGVPNV